MDDLGKLDDRLMDSVLGERQGTAVVLVEPDLPRPQVRLMPGSRGPGQRPAIAIEQPEPIAAARQIEDDLRRLLSQLATAEPEWLEAGQVFVIELDGAALATLAGSPLVRRIHPNTERHGQ